MNHRTIATISEKIAKEILTKFNIESNQLRICNLLNRINYENELHI